MYPMRSLLAFMFLMMITSGVAGCAATPQDRWYQQREALNTANQIYLANVPQMNEQQIVQRGQLLQAARTSLITAQSQLPEGGSAFDSALDVVQSILVQLAAPDATTQPAPVTTTSLTQEPPHDPR